MTSGVDTRYWVLHHHYHHHRCHGDEAVRSAGVGSSGGKPEAGPFRDTAVKTTTTNKQF